MSWTQLAYASRPFRFDAAMLNGILSDARRLNPPNDVTGAQICRADLHCYFAVAARALEGESRASCLMRRSIGRWRLVDLFINFGLAASKASGKIAGDDASGI
jgi:hypothetical protein